MANNANNDKHMDLMLDIIDISDDLQRILNQARQGDPNQGRKQEPSADPYDIPGTLGETRPQMEYVMVNSGDAEDDVVADLYFISPENMKVKRSRNAVVNRSVKVLLPLEEEDGGHIIGVP